jgi:hypothetical protein
MLGIGKVPFGDLKQAFYRFGREIQLGEWERSRMEAGGTKTGFHRDLEH